MAKNGKKPGTFTFSDGREVSLNALGEAIITGLMSETGKPKAPQREVSMAGGGKIMVSRTADEPLPTEEEIAQIEDPQKREEAQAYRKWRLELQAWNMQQGLRFARTLFLLGVKDGPTAQEAEIWQAIGYTDPYDIKYMWLAYLCRDIDEWNRFIEAVLSYSMPTEEGQAEMKELFRGSVAGQPPQTVGAAGHVG